MYLENSFVEVFDKYDCSNITRNFTKNNKDEIRKSLLTINFSEQGTLHTGWLSQE